MSNWFYSVDGRNNVGPISQEELIYLIAQGRLNSQTLVFKEGMSQWVYASTVDSLFPKNVPSYQPLNPQVIPQPYISDRPQVPPLPNYNLSHPNALSSSVPPEIQGWNWGAFLISPIWSIGNGVWIGLLSFVPYVGIGMAIYLGIKGNELAWKSKRWQSIEQFKSAQRSWAIAGLIVLVLAFLLGILIGASGS
jgi:hypothetical protein